MVHRIRQRQDWHSASVAERVVNDVSARETYEQLLLDSIRNGDDPNAPTPVMEYAGYVEPSVDERRCNEVTREHREFIHDMYDEREYIIKTLRSSEEHQQLSAFERVLRETEYYTGVREWTELSASSTSARRNRQEDEKTSHIRSKYGLSTVSHMTSSAKGQELDMAESAVLTTTPSYIRGTLREYQIEGVNWLLSLFSRGVNGILADEMGLGKTFQTIALLAYLKFTLGIKGPHLVVCPKSVMGNWFRELKHWCPALKVYKFHASNDLRPTLIKSHLQPVDHIKYDVVVTTYEMIIDELNAFKRIEWQYLIVDEAHKLKNEEGRTHSALSSLHSAHRLIITGTPLQNNLQELWALLNFLAPRLFDDIRTFDSWFDTASGQQDANVMSNLHKILAPLMIRRLKAEVSTGIPPKKEIYVSCRLSKKQREWYMHVLAKDAEILNKSGSNTTSLTNVLMNLRKVINHPYLMDGGEDGPPFITDEKLVRASGKMIIMDKLLHRLHSDVEGHHKILIFSQFTSMLNILEDYCNMRHYKYCRIDGQTSGYDRDNQMARFNAPTSEYFIFLLSTRAGGLGINLQAANHVIIYDSDWNPQMDLQAQDRAHRIGQRRSVRVYRFITDGTMEEKIYQRALKKLYLDAMVVQQGRLQSKTSNQLSKEEMLAMIRFGAEEVFKTRHEDINEADIDRLLYEGEAKSSSMTNEMKSQVQMSLASFQLGAEEANIYEFEGVSFKSGAESRILLVKLTEPISQVELHTMCMEFGEVMKVALHPNLTEALVYFRSLGGAIEAHAKLPFTSSYVSKDAQTIVTSEMVAECLGAGEKLGRGHRVREPVQFYSEAEVETLQKKVAKAPPLRLPKPPRFRPFQLYNAKRLLELHNTEVAMLVQAWRHKYENKPHKHEHHHHQHEQHNNNITNNIDSTTLSNNANSANIESDANGEISILPSSKTDVLECVEKKEKKEEELLEEADAVSAKVITTIGKQDEAIRSNNNTDNDVDKSNKEVNSDQKQLQLLEEEKKEASEVKDVDEEEKEEESDEEEDGNQSESEEEEEEEDALTAVEQEERERLLSEGFPHWTYEEYRSVVMALTSKEIDLTDYSGIASVVNEVGNKTVGEVRDYVLALLERGEQCIKNFDKIEQRINKAQQKRHARDDIFRAAKWKVENCTHPEEELTFKNKGNILFDRQLFLKAYDNEFKSANYGEIIRMQPENRFNIWYQSRPEEFYNKRLHSLMASVKREWERPAEEDENDFDRPHSRRKVEIMQEHRGKFDEL